MVKLSKLGSFSDLPFLTNTNIADKNTEDQLYLISLDTEFPVKEMPTKS